MNSSDQAPRIPLWVIIADLVLLAAAAFIAANSPRPLSSGAVIGVVACVVTGACVLLIPWVVQSERQKNDVLNERQRALEALAATVSNSAEQVGIATAGLQQVAELVQKNLRHAEQLPQRLQEKMAEFQSQLANASDGEREELEKEVAALRETETERLESLSDRLTRAVAEFGKLEAATQQHLTTASEAIGKLSLGTAGAIGKAQAAAEQALGHARVEAARQLAENAGQQLRALDAAKAAALSEFEAKIAAASNAAAERVAREIATTVAPALAALDAKINRLETTAHSAPPHASDPQAKLLPDTPEPVRAENQPVATAQPASVPTPAPQPPAAELPPASGPQPSPAVSAAPDATPVAASAPRETAAEPPAPRRIRKPRREEPAVVAAAAGATASAASTPGEPAPVLLHQIAEVTPIAPHTTEPFSLNAAPVHGRADNGNQPEPRPSKREKRPEQRPAALHQPELLDDLLPPAGEDTPTPGIVERVLSSDGATRLLVTAYIGIGNRLFIRGEGPGLSWDKGVPLHFVSIGKWRWETNEASAPIRFKLLKNDEQECAGLGSQTLDPGHQQEVTAAF